jgi:hypothetical protein
MSYPSFESGSGKLESVLKRDRLIDGVTVMEEEQFLRVVDSASFGEPQSTGIGDGIGGRIVKVAIACVPLGACRVEEEMRPMFHKEARLVSVVWKAKISQVGLLERDPRVVKKTVE